MHLNHIVSLIGKISAGHPEMYQDLIDLATLGYRDGLLHAKINEIAINEDIAPSEIDAGDITPEEMQGIIVDTENWFRGVMSIYARRAVESHDEEIKGVPVQTKNRVQIAMDELIRENPGLFD